MNNRILIVCNEDIVDKVAEYLTNVIEMDNMQCIYHYRNEISFKLNNNDIIEIKTDIGERNRYRGCRYNYIFIDSNFNINATMMNNIIPCLKGKMIIINLDKTPFPENILFGEESKINNLWSLSVIDLEGNKFICEYIIGGIDLKIELVKRKYKELVGESKFKERQILIEIISDRNNRIITITDSNAENVKMKFKFERVYRKKKIRH